MTGGREASFARRRALSLGKNGSTPPAPSREPAPEATAAAQPAIASQPSAISGREVARLRRAAASHGGKAPAGLASSSVSAAPIAPAAPVAPNGARDVRVTGYQEPSRVAVTGEPRGDRQREPAAKVGHVRTMGGLVVSGTVMRGHARVTGDEAGASARITGESDPGLDDDLTTRKSSPGSTMRLSPAASRRSTNGRVTALEATARGLPVSGTAVGRSMRVTGDEAGAARSLTGAQYAASETVQPADQGLRQEPVTGAKVVVGTSRGGQRITGPDVEHGGRVTGAGRGADFALTGSQYAAAAGERSTPSTGFSVTSPQRAAHARAAAEPRASEFPITGVFAVGGDKITGNLDFAYRARTSGTGSRTFSGTRHFASFASHEEPKRLVTGMSGYTSEDGARVTLSGGAQG